MEDKNREHAHVNIEKMAWIGIYNAHVEHQYIHMEGQVDDGKSAFQDAEADATEDASSDEELVAKLKPIFYNNEEDVRQFLETIRGMADNDITDVVNRWVQDKRISDYGNSRKGMLWNILHKAGLYSKTKSNWNGRVS